MKKIDSLIEKYLMGETSLQEEALLKDLVDKESDSVYDVYKEMFRFLEASQREVILKNNFEKRFLSKLRYGNQKRRRIYQISSISIAASIFLAVGFFTLTQKKEAFVIEQGVRYDDMEKAVEFADEAINEAIAPLQQSMQSLEPIMGLEGALTPSFTNNDSVIKMSLGGDTMLQTIN